MGRDRDRGRDRDLDREQEMGFRRTLKIPISQISCQWGGKPGSGRHLRDLRDHIRHSMVAVWAREKKKRRKDCILCIGIVHCAAEKKRLEAHTPSQG